MARRYHVIPDRDKMTGFLAPSQNRISLKLPCCLQKSENNVLTYEIHKSHDVIQTWIKRYIM